MHTDEVWNAIIDVINAMDYPTGDAAKDEAFLLFQFYSAMVAYFGKLHKKWSSN